MTKHVARSQQILRFPCFSMQGHIFPALQRVKLVPGNCEISSLQYSRCGRTDKGVSALGQVRNQCNASQRSTVHMMAMPAYLLGHSVLRLVDQLVRAGSCPEAALRGTCGRTRAAIGAGVGLSQPDQPSSTTRDTCPRLGSCAGQLQCKVRSAYVPAGIADGGALQQSASIIRYHLVCTWGVG